MNKRKCPILILITMLAAGLMLTACVGTRNPLDGTNWQLEMYRDQTGDLVTVLFGATVTAQFQATKVSGIAGCNNFSSSYEVNGDRLIFSPAATTRKSCADPDGIMEQEYAYLEALEQVQTFAQSGDRLEMRSWDGETILVFTPYR